MLGQRVITALLLVAIFLPALFHPEPQSLAALSLVLISLAGWEWGRLMGCQPMAAIALGLACLVVCVFSWWSGLVDSLTPVFWLTAVLIWVLGGGWMLRFGMARWLDVPMALRCFIGLGLLWATWMALFCAKTIGTNFMLSVLLLVWMADIAAYFSGRAWGQRKLAPSISPGKSWEGVAGAVLGVAALALCWLQWDALRPEGSPSIYAILMNKSWLAMTLGLLLMTGMSVVGDLVESLLKRCAGVKDSSGLLPGHGGVLDRIDALLPTFPLALCLYAWVRA